MFAKAMLVCEDVRLDSNGTVTLVGVYSERLFAPAGEGALRVPRLRFVSMIGGLRGVETLRFRHVVKAIGDRWAIQPPFRDEAHDPASDEHNFVFGDDPVVFPGEGEYELATDIEARGEKASFRYRFHIARMSAARREP